MGKKPQGPYEMPLPNSETLRVLLANSDFQALLKKSGREYLHWDRFRYQKMPDGLSPQVAWEHIRMMRLVSMEFLPILQESGLPFSINVTKWHQRTLSFVDSRASGIYAEAVDSINKESLAIKGLIEEAISSSQIEGASTTRKVAKAMIESNRRPQSRDERMILNNYNAMMKLEEWKSRELSDEFLLELHQILTEGTLDEKSDEGRFREDSHEVVVSDRVTGRVVHRPPPMAKAQQQLAQLYRFANSEDEDDGYFHPFVKASILHFCLGYIHPFVDGNGRSARALFYWYLLKKGYWMFTFFPISLQIKKKDWRPGYDRAFENVESDGGDITYFLDYKLKVVESAIQEFIKYIEKKQREASALKRRLDQEEINPRQVDVIKFLQDNPRVQVDIRWHMNRTGVVYQTARTDLLALREFKILKQIKAGKRFFFVRGDNFPSDDG